MNVHLSELKQRVKILRPVATEDEVGNLIEQGRSEVATVWAMVLPYAAKISDGYAEKVDEVKAGLITSRRIIFTPAVELKDELAGTAIQITCYDRDGKEVKRVTSTDDAEVEDNENEGNGTTENGGTTNGDGENGGSGSNTNDTNGTNGDNTGGDNNGGGEGPGSSGSMN